MKKLIVAALFFLVMGFSIGIIDAYAKSCVDDAQCGWDGFCYKKSYEAIGRCVN